MLWLGILLAAATAAAAAVVPVAAGDAIRERAVRFKVEAHADNYLGRGFCVSYQVPGNSLVTGYVQVNNPHQAVRAAAVIYEGINQPFSRQDMTSGEAAFSFRSRAEASLYEACVRALPRSSTSLPKGLFVDVALNIKWTFDLFDDALAKAVVLEPFEAEFYQLEEMIGRLDKELSDFVLHEEVMRDTNESTLSRVRFFAALAILAMVALGLYQLYYLKRFFKMKKLI